MLDPSPGPVGGCREQFVSGCFGQAWRQQDHRAQVQPAVRDGAEDRRETPRRAGGVNPLERRLLRIAQLVQAILIHRRIARWNESLAQVDFGDQGQHYRRGAAFPGGLCNPLANQWSVGETRV